MRRRSNYPGGKAKKREAVEFVDADEKRVFNQVVITNAQFTSSGELWITEIERESDVFVTFTKDISITTYNVLISLQNVLFPHILQKQPQNRIDITSIHYSLDVPANGGGAIKFGVVTRIDDIDADISFFGGIPFFHASKTTVVESLKETPSQIKLDFANGILQHGLTNVKESNVSAVNTGALLDSPAGNINPGLCDVILKLERTAGTTPLNIFMFYHTR